MDHNIWHILDDTVNINKVDTIRVTCDIVCGSYKIRAEGHMIRLHEFYPTVEPGYKIVEKLQYFYQTKN